MNSPPGNANAALTKRRREKLTDVLRAYHAPGLVQSGIILKRWEGEARRLLIEFWRTADDRHLCAFTTHIRAMRMRARREN
jgi:hypothetical protein